MNIAAKTLCIWRISLLAALVALSGLLAAGCGGEQPTAGAAAPVKVEVARWVFPKRQPLGTPAIMKIVVRNIDTRDLRQLAINVDGLRIAVQQERAGSRTRPVWMINESLRGDQTPFDTLTSSTFDLGPLAAGDSTTFTLPLTPLRRGEHQVSYQVTDGLTNGTPAENADGSPAAAKRMVVIDPTPALDESVFD